MRPDERNKLDRDGMAQMLKHLVQRLYGAASVPPTEGGDLFRMVCDERRRQGDFFWTERRLHDLARELGYWPWSVNQICAAARLAADEEIALHSPALPDLEADDVVTPIPLQPPFSQLSP